VWGKRHREGITKGDRRRVQGVIERRVRDRMRRGGGLSPSDLGSEKILSVRTEDGSFFTCAKEGRVLDGSERTSLGCQRGVWEVGSVKELRFRNTHSEESRYLVEVGRSSRIPPESCVVNGERRVVDCGK